MPEGFVKDRVILHFGAVDQKAEVYLNGEFLGEHIGGYEAFSFDNFAWQRDNKISIDVPFRADGLQRILYKCPRCGAENHMEGKGIHLTCHACNSRWTMDC